jgi:hypothetical protein
VLNCIRDAVRCHIYSSFEQEQGDGLAVGTDSSTCHFRLEELVYNWGYLLHHNPLVFNFNNTHHWSVVYIIPDFRQREVETVIGVSPTTTQVQG